MFSVTMFSVTLIAVFITMALALTRAALGPSVFDRILALNMFGTKTVPPHGGKQRTVERRNVSTPCWHRSFHKGCAQLC